MAILVLFLDLNVSPLVRLSSSATWDMWCITRAMTRPCCFQFLASTCCHRQHSSTSLQRNLLRLLHKTHSCSWWCNHFLYQFHRFCFLSLHWWIQRQLLSSLGWNFSKRKVPLWHWSCLSRTVVSKTTITTDREIISRNTNCKCVIAWPQTTMPGATSANLTICFCLHVICLHGGRTH